MKGRVYSIDAAKLITAFLVVFTHLYTADDPFRQWVYSFHMPLFFMLSGMFHREYSITNAFVINARRLIVPALFFMACGVLIYICIYGVNSLLPVLRKSIYGMIAGDKIQGNNVIWFLFALFWCNIFLNMILKYRWTIYPLLFVYIVVVIILHFSWLHLSQGLFALPFYMLGYWINRKNFADLLNCHLSLKRRSIMAVGGGYLIVSQYTIERFAS